MSENVPPIKRQITRSQMILATILGVVFIIVEIFIITSLFRSNATIADFEQSSNRTTALANLQTQFLHLQIETRRLLTNPTTPIFTQVDQQLATTKQSLTTIEALNGNDSDLATAMRQVRLDLAEYEVVLNELRNDPTISHFRSADAQLTNQLNDAERNYVTIQYERISLSFNQNVNNSLQTRRLSQAVLLVASLFIFLLVMILVFSFDRVFRTEFARTFQMVGSLENAVAAKTRDLTLAVEVGHSLTQVRNLEALLNEAVNIIRSRFHLYHTQIYLIDPFSQRLILKAGTGPAGIELLRRNHQLPIDFTSLNGMAAANKELVVVSDTQSSPNFRPNPLLPDTHSESAIPLLIGNQVLGVLDLQSEQLNGFSPENLPAFEAVASQLAIAIENANLFTITQQSKAELENLTQRMVAENWAGFMNAIDRPEQLGFAYERGEVKAQPSQTIIYPDENVLMTTITLGNQPIGTIELVASPDKSWTNEQIEFTNVVAQQVAQQMENLRLLAEARQYRSQAEQAVRQLTREGWEKQLNMTDSSSIGYIYDGQEVKVTEQGSRPDNFQQPLVIRGESIGYLAFTPDDTFDAEESESIINAISERLTDHIENLRLSQQTRQALAEAEERSAELALINRIVSAISSSLDLNQSLQIVADELAAVLTAGRSGIALLDPTGSYLTVIAEHRTPNAPIGLGATIPIEGNITTQQVLTTRKSLVIPDVQHDPRTQPIHELMRTHNIYTLIIIPMISGNRVIGTAGIDILQPNQLIDPAQLKLAETIVYQATIAIENAKLFDQMQHALARTEALYEAVRSLLSAGNVENVLNVAVESVIIALQADRVSFIRFDLEKEHILNFVTGGPGQTDIVTTPFHELWDGLSGWVLRNQQPALSPKNAPDPRESPAVQQRRVETNCGSIIVVPLIYQTHILGTITVINRPEQRDFDQGDVNLLVALASQAAIVLDNRLLFSATQQRARQLEQLAIIEANLSQASTEQQLVSAILDRLDQSDLIISAMGHIRQRGNSKQYFKMVSLWFNGQFLSNPPAELQEIEVGAFPITAYWIENPGQLLLIPNIHDPSVAPAVRQQGQQQGWQAIMLMPLLSGGTLQGLYTLNWKHPHLFSDDELFLFRQLVEPLSARVASQRAYLIQKEALAESQKLYQVTAGLNVAQSPNAILQVAINIAQPISAELTLIENDSSGQPAWFNTISSWRDQANQGFSVPVGWRTPAGEFPDAVNWLNNPFEPFIVNNITTDSRLSQLGQQIYLGAGSRAWVVLPLTQSGRWLGFVSMTWGKIQDFSDTDQRIYRALAEQTAVVVNQWLLLEQTNTQAQRLENLASVEEALSRARNEEEVLESLALYAIEGALVQAESDPELLAALSLYEDPNRRITLHYIDEVEFNARPETAYSVAHWSGGAIVSDDPFHFQPFAITEHPAVELALSRPEHPLFIENIEQDERLTKQERQIARSMDIMAMCVLPLRNIGRWQGFISFTWAIPHPFNESEQFVITRLQESVSAVIASRRAYLAQQKALGESQTLYDVSSRLNEAQTLEETLLAAISPAIPAGANRANLWTLQLNQNQQPITQTLAALWGQLPTQQTASSHIQFGLDSFPLAHLWLNSPDEPLLISNVANDSRLDDNSRQTLLNLEVLATIYMPLRLGQRWVGLINIRWPHTYEFTDTDRKLYRSLATQAAAVVESRLLFRATQERASQLSNLAHIQTELSQVQDELQVINLLGKSAISNTLWTISLAYLQVDENNQPITIITKSAWVNGEITSEGPLFNQPFDLQTIPISKLWIDHPNEMLFFDDVLTDPRCDEASRQFCQMVGLRTLAVMPLFVGGRWQGLVTFVRPEPYQFTTDEKFLLHQLIEPVGAIITTRRALLAEEEIRQQTERLYEAGRKINEAGRDLQALLAALPEAVLIPAVNRVIMVLFEYDLDKEIEGMTIVANWHSGSGNQPSPVGLHYSYAAFKAIGFIQTTEPVVISDPQNDSRLDPSTYQIFQQLKINTMAVIPLLTANRQLGALLLETERPYTFLEQDIRAYRSLADQMAVAVDNLSLFRQTQEQLQETQALQNLSKTLAGTLQASEVFDLFFKACQEVIGFEYVQLSLVNKEEGRVKAVTGLNISANTIANASQPLDSNDIMADIIRTGATEIITGWDARLDKEIFDQEGHMNWIRVFTPINLRQENIGLIEAGFKKGSRQRIQDSHVRLLRAFIDQMTLAFDNAQQYEASQERARREQILRELTTKVRSSTNVDVILQTAAREIGQVLGRKTFAYIEQSGTQPPTPTERAK